jgi:hypothetical protein
VWDELLQLCLRFASGASGAPKPLPKRGKMSAAAQAAERDQSALF